MACKTAHSLLSCSFQILEHHLCGIQHLGYQLGYWSCTFENVLVLEIPKGSLLKQYLPNGVRNVVNSWDSVSSEICQNPLFVSILENTVVPDSCDKVVSTFGSGWTSLSTFSFSPHRCVLYPIVLGPLPCLHTLGFLLW